MDLIALRTLEAHWIVIDIRTESKVIFPRVIQDQRAPDLEGLRLVDLKFRIELRLVNGQCEQSQKPVSFVTVIHFCFYTILT